MGFAETVRRSAALPPPEFGDELLDDFSLEVCTSAEPDVWDEEVARLGGCAFHTWRWICFSAASNGGEPRFFIWKNEAGAIIALAGGTESVTRAAGVPITRTLSLGSLPAARDEHRHASLVRALVTYAKDTGCAVLNLHSFGTPWIISGLETQGFVSSRRWEFLLDLTGTLDELWAKLHAKKRNLIRKAQKEGISVIQGEGFAAMMLFQELGMQTYLRKKARGIVFPQPAGEKYFRLLQDQVVNAGLGRLYLAKRGNTCVGGAFVVGFAGQSYYLLSAATDDGLSAAAPDLLLWSAISEFQARGYRSFNFGGISEAELGGESLESSGLYHFKVRFSPKVLSCVRGSVELRPLALRAVRLAKRVADGVRGL